MVVERVKIAEASKVGELFFYNHNYAGIEVGKTHNGFEFYSRIELNKNPVLTGKDLVLYAENGRLKGQMKLICHDKEELPHYFNPACNKIRFMFDDRESGCYEHGTIDLENIDLVDVENPDILDDGTLQINIRFIMKGFHHADHFIFISDEMKNWFKSLGVVIWLNQRPVLVKTI